MGGTAQLYSRNNFARLGSRKQKYNQRPISRHCFVPYQKNCANCPLYQKKHPETKLVQLGHIGRTGIKDFTFIFAPEHDKNKFNAPNIHYTVGCPHFVTREKLDSAYQKWHDKFSTLPHPVTAVIIGGAIKKHPFSLENAEQLAFAVKNLKKKEGGSLLITTSRRTGTAAEEKIMSTLNAFPHYAYLWGTKDENPYLGFLACADNIVVTGDSVSMCSEATATGKH